MFLVKIKALDHPSTQHQARHGRVHPRLFSGGLLFEIFAQAPKAIQPAKGAFDHPAPRQYLKAWNQVSLANHAMLSN